MKQLFFLFAFLSWSVAGSAQKSFGTVVAGLESGFDVAQFSDGLKARMSPALQVEFSIGRFSLGAGVGKKFYFPYEFYSFTGESVLRNEGGQVQLYYLADLHTFKFSYWTFPLKVNYRLHRCDCVYLHAGVTFEKVDLSKPDVIKFRNAEFPYYQYNPAAMNLQRGQFVVPNTRTYEIGIGFNVFRRDFFRLTARPTYALTQNPEVFTDGPEWLPTLRFTFGAQFALWREREDD